jgi:hypothetical protein
VYFTPGEYPVAASKRGTANNQWHIWLTNYNNLWGCGFNGDPNYPESNTMFGLGIGSMIGKNQPGDLSGIQGKLVQAPTRLTHMM